MPAEAGTSSPLPPAEVEIRCKGRRTRRGQDGGHCHRNLATYDRAKHAITIRCCDCHTPVVIFLGALGI